MIKTVVQSDHVTLSGPRREHVRDPHPLYDTLVNADCNGLVIYHNHGKRDMP